MLVHSYYVANAMVLYTGLALEYTQGSDLASALQVYKSTTRIPPPSIGLYLEWRIWTEKALGRFALVAYKCWVDDEERAQLRRDMRISGYSTFSTAEGLEDSEVGVAIGPTVDDYTVLFAFRSYHKHINAISGFPSTTVKDVERGQVYRKYLRYLSSLMSPNFSTRFGPTRQPSRATMNSYPSSLAGGVRNSSIGVVGGGLVGGIGITKDELKDEIRSIQSIYESYFMPNISFPKADEVHSEVLEWVDLVMANWRKMGPNGEDAVIIIEVSKYSLDSWVGGFLSAYSERISDIIPSKRKNFPVTSNSAAFIPHSDGCRKFQRCAPLT